MNATGSANRPPEAALYDAYAERLLRIVGSQVRTPQENVEDACHFAWTQYLSHADDIQRESAPTWLAKTAIRQAWKLDARTHRELSLDAEAESVGELPLPSRLPGPAERAESRERLGQLRQLPERQQRLVWLQAAGLSYVEMAAYTGDSVRTVERQILRATARVRQLQEERGEHERGIQRPTLARIGPRVDSRHRTHDDLGIER